MIWYRDNGYRVDVVERFNPHAGPHGKRFDWCGIADIIAVPILEPGGHHTDGRIEFCQATTGTNVAGHARSYERTTQLKGVISDVVGSGNIFVIHGWRKLKGQGRRQWFPRMMRAVFDVDGLKWEVWDGLGSTMPPWKQTEEGEDDGDAEMHTLPFGVRADEPVPEALRRVPQEVRDESRG